MPTCHAVLLIVILSSTFAISAVWPNCLYLNNCRLFIRLCRGIRYEFETFISNLPLKSTGSTDLPSFCDSWHSCSVSLLCCLIAVICVASGVSLYCFTVFIMYIIHFISYCLWQTLFVLVTVHHS